MNNNQQPNKTSAGTNAAKVKQQDSQAEAKKNQQSSQLKTA
ncbi:hypothetical protein [Priestia megaterium]